MPSWLIWMRSWMISQLVTGSRLPVGSSAMRIAGSWTRARAIAVRCCSPPESWVGRWWAWSWRPTRLSSCGTRCRMVGARRAGHVEREGDVLPDRLVRQQPEVLEDDPDAPPQPGHLARAACGSRSRPATRTWPWVGSCSRMRSRMNVLLPAPDGPTRNTKSPRRDRDVDVAERDLAVGVGHADVDHADDRCVGFGLVRAAASQEGCHRFATDGTQWCWRRHAGAAYAAGVGSPSPTRERR